jgi:hypothetical protein
MRTNPDKIIVGVFGSPTSGDARHRARAKRKVVLVGHEVF